MNVNRVDKSGKRHQEDADQRYDCDRSILAGPRAAKVQSGLQIASKSQRPEWTEVTAGLTPAMQVSEVALHAISLSDPTISQAIVS